MVEGSEAGREDEVEMGTGSVFELGACCEVVEIVGVLDWTGCGGMLDGAGEGACSSQ